MKTKKMLTLLLACIMALSSLMSVAFADGLDAANLVKADEAEKDDKFAIIIGDTSKAVEGYQKEEVIMLTNEAYDSFYPWGSVAGMEALQEIYEPLFVKIYGTADMIPVLADGERGEFGGWDHVAGTPEYTVYVLDYVFDSAGNHFTASDVAYTLQLQKNAGILSNKIASWEVLDDTSIKIVAPRELDGVMEFQNVICGLNMCTQAGYEASPSGFVSDTCGTGPYVLTSYTSGAEVVIEARDDYWQKDETKKAVTQQANVKRIKYEIIKENAQKVIALESGGADIVPSLHLTDIGRFINNDQFTIFNWMQTGAKHLLLNCGEMSVCQDVNLRKAIYYAIDVDMIAASQGAGNAKPCYSLIPPAMPDYYVEWENADNYNAKTDLALAKEYLAKSNYKGETLVLITEGTYSTVAQVMMNMLAQVGIKIEIQTLDKTTLTSVRTSGKWDLNIDQKAGNMGVLYLENVLSKSSNQNEMTSNWIKDDKLQADLLNTTSLAGFTKENIEAFMDYLYDNAYIMNLYSSYNFTVVRNNIVTMVMASRNKEIPGALTYTPED